MKACATTNSHVIKEPITTNFASPNCLWTWSESDRRVARRPRKISTTTEAVKEGKRLRTTLTVGTIFDRRNEMIYQTRKRPLDAWLYGALDAATVEGSGVFRVYTLEHAVLGLSGSFESPRPSV